MAASPEVALLESAGGVFWATLLAFLVIVIVGAFLWFMKRILDQNAAFQAQIIESMGSIVAGMKEYNKSTCDAIEKHDQQAKTILSIDQEIRTTLQNRPCIASKNAK